MPKIYTKWGNHGTKNVGTLPVIVSSWKYNDCTVLILINTTEMPQKNRIVNEPANLLKIFKSSSVSGKAGDFELEPYGCELRIYGDSQNAVDLNKIAEYFKKIQNTYSEADPFGMDRMQFADTEIFDAEKWQQSAPGNMLHVIRPTVIFGEGNRGNVYNLFNQLASGKFMMVGNGKNKKSMAYVGNVAAFLKWNIEENQAAYSVYNYIDKPDYNMLDLVTNFENILGRKFPPLSLPYWLGLCGGYCFDILAFITRKNFPISSIRVKKFCAQTVFNSDKMQQSGFQAPYSMPEALKRVIEFEFK